MNLVIDTTALDKSNSVVTAIGSTTPVTGLQELTVGDNEPVQILFTAGAAGTPAFAGAAGYTCTVGLGMLDVDGLANYCSAVLGTPVASGWSGILGLTTQQLYDSLKFLVGSAVDWSRFPTGTRTPYPRPPGGWMALQVTITDLSGNIVTYADLRIFVRVRVMPRGAGTTGITGLVAGAPGATIGAVQGQTTQAVTFATPFATGCSAVIPVLSPPSGATLACWPTNISKNGFTANFASSIPGAGWQLSYIATGN